MKNKNTEYKIEQLPKNRKELFFDIIKNNFLHLLGISFILTIAFLPFILYRYYNLIVINQIIADAGENTLKSIKNTLFIEAIVNVALLQIIAFCLSGILKIYKRYSFGEGVFFASHFFQGIKENFKDFFFVFLIYGFINVILTYIEANYLIANPFIYYLLKIINLFVFIPLLCITLCLCNIYSDPLPKKIKGSLLIYIKYFPKIFIIFVIAYLPLLLLLINQSYIQVFGLMLYSLIYLPYVLLAFVLLCNNIFDKMINKTNFPDIVNKGLNIN